MGLPRTPSFRLDGRCALVTGGSKGIGLAAAAALVEAGAHVTVVARGAAELEAARTELQAACTVPGQQVVAAPLDVTDAAAVDALVQRQAQQQPFDILVNNAGTNRPHPLITDLPDADYRRGAGPQRQGHAVRHARGGRAACWPLLGPGCGHQHLESQMGHVGGPQAHAVLRHQACGRGHDQGAGLGGGAAQGIRVNTHVPDLHRDRELTAPMFPTRRSAPTPSPRTALGRHRPHRGQSWAAWCSWPATRPVWSPAAR
jgi:hypothetical protein